MGDLLQIRQTLAVRGPQRVSGARRALARAVRDRLRPADADSVLARGALEHEVMVYFADPPVNLYQIRQWLYPLERLNQVHPVFILTREHETCKVLTTETELPVVNVRRVGTIDSLCTASDFKLALYVNQTPANFSALRYPAMLHVYLNHGDSDKLTYSASNQVKAYDFVFVPGEAAAQRYRSTLVNFDVDEHLRTVGRPQLDIPRGVIAPAGTDRTTVLYAPTWEGDRPSTAYGSVESHGPQIVAALVDSAAHRLIYRPHPRIGATRREAADVDKALRRTIRDAARRHPEAGHRVDLDPHFGPQMDEADLLICDVSAVALDFLPTGKPLVVTDPVGPMATVDRSGALGSAYSLAVSDLAGVARLVDDCVADDLRREDRAGWVEYHFGDVRPGASIRRFLDACEEAIQLRDKLVSAKQARPAAHS